MVRERFGALGRSAQVRGASWKALPPRKTMNHPPNVLTLCCESANARPAPRGAAVAAFDLTRLQPPRRRTKSDAAAGSAGGTATAARQHLRRVRRPVGYILQ